jgi:type 1 glutamine amidotransferase
MLQGKTTMNRRDLLKRTGGAALALGTLPFPLAWTAEDKKSKKILMYTRSVGYQHDVVKRKKPNELSLAESIVTDLGKKNGFEVVCEKDGRVFLSSDFPTFDGFVFETQGNLLSEKSQDNSPPMTADGKKALLDAIAGGKGYVGCHCASDTFHSKGPGDQNQKPEDIDPYIAMVGGEFIRHGQQQKGWMRVVDDNFPGAVGLKDFNITEEWYSLKNFAEDMHVILVQDTKGMVNVDYDRPNFPATWARMHKKGRVFFTSMGHRDDVWKNDTFQKLLLGAINWSLGNAEAKLTMNLKEVAPMASTLPDFKKKN